MTNFHAQSDLTKGDVLVDEDGAVLTVAVPLNEAGDMTLIEGSISDVDRADYTVSKGTKTEKRAGDFQVLVLRRTPTANKGH
jgi:hypothetical protein